MKGGRKMAKYIIKGSNKLEGKVKISGSKNAALPIIAASILNAGKQHYIMYQIYMIPRWCLKF